MNHKHAYQGKSLKCVDCLCYPWEDVEVVEKKMFRSCLANRASECPKMFKTTKDKRICPLCSRRLKDGNYV